MKKLLLATASLALTASAALAADLPSRKAELLQSPPPPMWTGFYAGLNAGYGFGTNSNTTTTAYGPAPYWLDNTSLSREAATPFYLQSPVGLALSSSTANNQSGFIGGGQIGYNYQYGSTIVLGIEADIQGSGIRGTSNSSGVGIANAFNPDFIAPGGPPLPPGPLGNSHTATAIGTSIVTSGVDWLGTVRGRLGYLVMPTLMIFGTGGFTYGGVYATAKNYAAENVFYARYLFGELTDTFNKQRVYVGGGQGSQVLTGWNAGGGFEWMFASNWSVKAEAIYWNIGSMNLNVHSSSAAPLVAALNPAQPNWMVSGFSTVGTARVSYQGIIARAGVNYHFNFGSSAPIVANY